MMDLKVPLKSLMPFLQKFDFANLGDQASTASVLRKQVGANVNISEDSDSTILQYVSTRDLDRDYDIMLPDGAELEEFKKAPQVLWAHDYSTPPIGVDIQIESDGYGIVALTKYAVEEHDLAATVYRLKKAGFLATNSVGFLPLSVLRRGEPAYDEKINELAEVWQVPVAELKKAQRIITKWLLLEHSDVPVPANINARVIKSLLGEGLKSVIPFEDLGTAPMDAEWDANAEVREASVDKLRKMCAWYDAEETDVKASYKLPHHRASDLKAVWRGVAAAMAALLGARGGVDIPERDRRGVYNHLVRHYEQFEKEPPAFHSAEGQVKRLIAPSALARLPLSDLVKEEIARALGRL